MHKKNIKLQIRKQLKTGHGSVWNKLSRKKKKAIVCEAANAIIGSYNFSEEITAPVEELLGIEEQMPTAGIITLTEMDSFLKELKENKIFKLNCFKRSALYITDEELRFVDGLIDDEVINKILAYDGYTPSMHEPGSTVANLFRAELLKTIKYPEISYRKFCSEQYIGLNNKENRVFMGLPLNPTL